MEGVADDGCDVKRVGVSMEKFWKAGSLGFRTEKSSDAWCWW